MYLASSIPSFFGYNYIIYAIFPKIISDVKESLRAYWHCHPSVTIDIVTATEGANIWIPKYVGSNRGIAIIIW